MLTGKTEYGEMRRSMASSVDMSARLMQLLDTPGTSEEIRKQAQEELGNQLRHIKRMERLLGPSSTSPRLSSPN
jgi:hypothetical protein